MSMPAKISDPVNGKKILIVEDDAQFAQMVSEWLGRIGNSVTVAPSGKGALKLLEQERFEVVITDIILPDFDGFELICHLRQRFSGVKVIAMSGGGVLSASTYVKIARELGAGKVLMKPFSQDELLLALAD